MINPATEEVVSDVAYGGRAETRRALEAAQAAMPAWSRLSAWDRGKILKKTADLMRARCDAIARTMTMEQAIAYALAAGEVLEPGPTPVEPNPVMLPPLTYPAGLSTREVEVLQLVEVDGAPHVMFSCGTAHAPPNPDGAPAVDEGWSYLCRGEGPLGPFDLDGALALRVPGLYSCRVVVDRAGRQQVLGFVLEDEAGDFAGELSDAIPLTSLLPQPTEGPR